MERMLNGIDRLSTGRNLVIAILVSAISVSVMAMLTQVMVYDVYGEAMMPDMNLGYSYDDILQSFDVLGSEGLNVWLQVHLLDLVFPLGYSFALAFGITMELRNSYPERKNLRTLSLLPLFAAFFDYLENTLIASQAAAYPNLSTLVISIASGVTILKWLFLFGAFAVVFILIALVLYKKSRN